jgi:hypothetical protein
LRIVDSNGTLVGYFVDGAGDSAIVPIGDSWYRLPVTTDGFVETPFSSFFESEDCSGTGFTWPVPALGKFFKPVLGVGAGKAYILGTDVADRLIKSSMDGGSGQCIPYGTDAFGAPMARIDIVSLSALVPPFKVAQ